MSRHAFKPTFDNCERRAYTSDLLGDTLTTITVTAPIIAPTPPPPPPGIWDQIKSYITQACDAMMNTIPGP